MRSPATVLLVDRARGVFRAEWAELEYGVLTACGSFDLVRKRCVRSWPVTGVVREVRWESEPPRKEPT